MNRNKMPRTANVYPVPSQCPCCPYGVSTDGIVRTDHLRRHVARMHTATKNFSYVDEGGNTIKKLTETRLIQLDKTGNPSNGFCFECGSWVCLLEYHVRNREGRMLKHICKEKQERAKRSGAPAPVKDVITMPSPQPVDTFKMFYQDAKKSFALLFKPEILKSMDDTLDDAELKDKDEEEIFYIILGFAKSAVNPVKAANQSEIINALREELSLCKYQHEEELEQKDIQHKTTVADLEDQKEALAKEISRLNALLYSK